MSAPQSEATVAPPPVLLFPPVASTTATTIPATTSRPRRPSSAARSLRPLFRPAGAGHALTGSHDGDLTIERNLPSGPRPRDHSKSLSGHMATLAEWRRATQAHPSAVFKTDRFGSEPERVPGLEEAADTGRLPPPR